MTLASSEEKTPYIGMDSFQGDIRRPGAAVSDGLGGGEVTLRLGAHESIAGGLYRAFDRAQSVGCEAVQIFVKSNRAWAAKSLTEEDVARFKAKSEETGIQPVVGHASYLLNLATPDEALWTKSRDTLIVELERCEALSVPYLVLILVRT